MNAKGFFNVLLVLSFLFSNLGGAIANPTPNSTFEPAWNIHSMLEKIGSWMEGLKEVKFISGDITKGGIKEAVVPTTWADIVPTPEPTLTPEKTRTPLATEIIPPTITPTALPTEDISPTTTPIIKPTEAFTQTQELSITLTAQPEKVIPGYPL
jgi:hypothetical protein